MGVGLLRRLRHRALARPHRPRCWLAAREPRRRLERLREEPPERLSRIARARELDEQIKAVEREVRAAVKSSISRTQRLRRTRLACFALVLVALLGVVLYALFDIIERRLTRWRG